MDQEEIELRKAANREVEKHMDDISDEYEQVRGQGEVDGKGRWR